MKRQYSLKGPMMIIGKIIKVKCAGDIGNHLQYNSC